MVNIKETFVHTLMILLRELLKCLIGQQLLIKIGQGQKSGILLVAEVHGEFIT